MRKLLLSIAVTVVGAAAISQTYWVHSATVSHSGGWPYDFQDTRGWFDDNGYVWEAVGAGGQLNPGGLQEDNSHAKVDAYYSLTGQGDVYGSATMDDKSEWMQRDNITITFKIRCSNVGMPSNAGAPVFDIRCKSEAEVHAVNSPFYNRAVATSNYIPPSSSTLLYWIAEAQEPGGDELDYPGYVAHKQETGSAPAPGWTNVGTNLWEVTVTVPQPAGESTDQDITVFGDAYANVSGSSHNAWTYCVGWYEFRCISLGGISLQDPF